MSNSTLDAVIWVLIYGGLLMLCLGIFVQSSAPLPGWTMVVIGGLMAVLGALGIVLRASREPRSSRGNDSS